MNLSRLILRFIIPPRRLKLTKEGWRFLILSLAIGFAAVNTGNNLLYLVMAMMLALITLSGVLSDLSLRGVHLSRVLPERLFAQIPFTAGITLENRKSVFASYSLRVEELLPTGEGPVYFLRIPAKGRATLSHSLTLLKRGWFNFEGFKVSTSYPFGLFVKEMRVPLSERVLVYPKIGPVPPQVMDGPYTFGEVPTFQRGVGGEFHSLREYVEGEDLRLVHWKSTAKAEKLMIREWEREEATKVNIVLDNSASEGLEEAVSLAGSYAAHFIEAGYPVRLITRDQMTEWGQGYDHLFQILEVLALLEAKEATGPFYPEGLEEGLSLHFGGNLGGTL